jgi:CyaY protein
MDESEFTQRADDVFARLERALDRCTADVDWEIQPGGVIEIEFGDGSKIIVNRHGAAKEIWVAARAGGFHFRHDPVRDAWIGTRDGDELFAALSRLASGQAGEAVSLG